MVLASVFTCVYCFKCFFLVGYSDAWPANPSHCVRTEPYWTLQPEACAVMATFDHRADPNVQNYLGATPLHYVLAWKHRNQDELKNFCLESLRIRIILYTFIVFRVLWIEVLEALVKRLESSFFSGIWTISLGQSCMTFTRGTPQQQWFEVCLRKSNWRGIANLLLENGSPGWDYGKEFLSR